jgi:hypothetical protein
MIRISTPIWAAVVAFSALAGGPALAASHGGGGGGGGHFGGGGGHSFGGHSFGGAPVAGHAFGGVHTAGYGGYAAHGYGAHFAGTVGYHGYAGYGGYGYRGFRPWGGGYWGGYYWPRAYFGLGFNWFLPALPLYYSTYWYSGVPYYYADDAYYTWSPSDGGYVATNPPPLAAGVPAEGPAPAGAPDAAPPPATGPAASDGQPGAAPGGERVFAYPKNNQTEEQQSTDRRECEQWAAGQTGAGNPTDYRRAMVVCFEGRGYSAQ